jgi:hypothetical protein
LHFSFIVSINSRDLVLVKLFYVFFSLVNALPQSHIICLLRCRYQLRCVLQHHFDEFLGDWSRVLHTGRHVNLNKPGIEVLINHKVIPDKLTTTLPAIRKSLTTLNRPHNNVLYFLNNLFPSLLANKGNKLTFLPHTFINNEILVVLLNGVVRQMLKSVMNVVQRVIISAESNVTLVIKPNFGRIVILNMDPLADIELFASNQ